MLSEQIAFLGGGSSVDVEKREISGNSVEKLQQDLAGEDNAIMRYRERIVQAEALKEYAVEHVVPCHCTGDAACAYLAGHLGSPVQPGYAGMKVCF